MKQEAAPLTLISTKRGEIRRNLNSMRLSTRWLSININTDSSTNPSSTTISLVRSLSPRSKDWKPLTKLDLLKQMFWTAILAMPSRTLTDKDSKSSCIKWWTNWLEMVRLRSKKLETCWWIALRWSYLMNSLTSSPVKTSQFILFSWPWLNAAVMTSRLK